MNAVLTIFFWALTYAVIVFYGFRYWKEHPVLMPLVSGSLNIAWELNAFIREIHFLGFVIWTVLDVAIVAINIHHIRKRSMKVLYIAATAMATCILWGVFNMPGIDGKFLSVYVLDLIMAVEYIVMRRHISGRGKKTIAVTKTLGDLFAWMCNMKFLVSAAVIGPIVLVLNCVYVYYCFIDRDFRLPVNTKTEEGTR